MASRVLYMEEGWLQALKEEFEKGYMRELEGFLKGEMKAGAVIYPPSELMFNALCQTPFQEVKAVILGQDPYHNPGQAHGLSFSVPMGVNPPPSLKNIYKELAEDLGIQTPSHGCLLSWAKQGVLLLNATLTVRENEPKSHYGKGWEQFTDAVIRKLAQRKDPIVFLLWGKSAQEKGDMVRAEGGGHLILEAAHPSPYSAHAGFLGCRHFSKTNEFLQKHGKAAIDWNLPTTL